MKAEASPFNLKLVAGLVAASILAFIALVYLLAYAEPPSPPGGGDAPAPSRSAVGYAGIVQLAGRIGPVDTVTAQEATYSEELLVVALSGAGEPAAIAELLNRRGPRATLLILPKWITRPDPRRRGWVRVLGTGRGARAARLLGPGMTAAIYGQGARAGPARGQEVLSGVTLPVPRDVQVISGPGLTPIATTRGGEMVLARLGERPHYVLAEPDLLNNHGLRDRAAAAAALRLLEALSPTGARAINFDVETGGRGISRSTNPSLLQLAFEPPLIVMTLALLFAALLAGYHGAFRFGPARREERAIAFGKTALVENSAGLIRLARREARLGGAYADVVRTEAARITGAPGWLGGDQLDAYLDRLGRSGAPRFTELAAAMIAANDRNALLQAARALQAWKKGLTR